MTDDDLIVGIAATEPMRSRISAVLRNRGVRLITEAESAEELIGACADRRPHVAVQSLATERAAAIRRLATGMPGTRIVAILRTVDRQAVRAALGAGAEGVVVAGQIALTLPVVVRSVALGQASVPRGSATDLEAPVLSRREHEVLDLVGAGLTNAEIATRLCVAETTVKRHLASVFMKLGVHSRMEAVAVAGDGLPGARRHLPATGPIRSIPKGKT
jgi:DNA-binding NarL/FixJ family response regulator